MIVAAAGDYGRHPEKYRSAQWVTILFALGSTETYNALLWDLFRQG